MPWKISIFFYLSLGFSLCGFIFPTHVTQAIGWDVGDMVHWIYGFYILFPRNPVGEPKLYVSFNGIFLLICAIILISVSYVELRNVKFGEDYDKNLIYVIAFIQLLASYFYDLTGFTVMRLSTWGFIFSAIFALMGNKELKLYYINIGIVNIKNERILGAVLIILGLFSLVYTIFIIIFFTDVFYIFSLSFAVNMLPGLILQLIMLLYGVYSLLKAKRINISKLQ